MFLDPGPKGKVGPEVADQKAATRRSIRLHLWWRVDALIHVADENKQAMYIRIDPDLVEALEAIRDAEGIPVSEQIRRGIRLWLDQKGAAQRTTRRTSSTRARGKRA